MSGLRRLMSASALLAAMLCVACPPAALAASGTAEGTPALSPPKEAVPAPAGAPVPAAGRMTLSLQRVGGSPPFALAGHRVHVVGTVAPYVPGQTVKISIYLQGRRVAVAIHSVLPAGHGKGQFRVAFTSRYPGVLDVRAAHYATEQQRAFKARAPLVRFVWPDLGPGSTGLSVSVLQSELAELHFAVPLDGVFDEGTGRALIAYRKITGLERTPYADRQVFDLLARGEGGFHVHYPGDGRHVEADLTTQVLAEIEPGGHVRAIYTMSSGKPSTPTVVGRFRVYLKTPGENSEGMVDSNYFIRGYAIHGYAEVPTYPASHGCLRVPIPDAPWIYAWVQYGTIVDVYNEGGGGSSRVLPNAGP